MDEERVQDIYKENINQLEKKKGKMIDINFLNKFNTKKMLRKHHPLLNALKIDNPWSWDFNSKSECVSLSDDSKTAYFFDTPYTISRGTAGVRGNKHIDEGVHYFEVLIKEQLYGTAIMIGIGTEEVCLHYENFDYVHLIGKDANGWGLSHKGTIWHNGISQKYCQPFFDKDAKIGILLNTYEKSIHFFINGIHQGLAFKNINLNGKKLYPMISSTATDVEIELVASYKLIYSLQDICCQNILKFYDDFDSLPIAKRLISYLKEY